MYVIDDAHRNAQAMHQIEKEFAAVGEDDLEILIHLGARYGQRAVELLRKVAGKTTTKPAEGE